MATPPVNTQTTEESTLSTWAGPYITKMLGQTEALGPATYDASGKLVSGLPFQAYDAERSKYYKDLASNLVAGPSELQTKAFQGLGNLTIPTEFDTAQQQAKDIYGNVKQYMPTIGTTESYMNPYLEAVLNPQRRAAEETAAKRRMENAARLSQAGAYGGSRQAIMEAEGERNLQQMLTDITGKGYADAYETARKQRESEMKQGLDALMRQESATKMLSDITGQEGTYGLKNIEAMMSAGADQRKMEQDKLMAAYDQFLREERYPREQLQFMRQMLAGIPGLATSSFYSAPTDPFAQIASGATGLMGLLTALGIVGKDK